MKKVQTRVRHFLGNRKLGDSAWETKRINRTTKTRISDDRLDELDEAHNRKQQPHMMGLRKNNRTQSSHLIRGWMKKQEHTNFIWWRNYEGRNSVQVTQHGRMRLMPIKLGIGKHPGQDRLGGQMKEPNDVRDKSVALHPIVGNLDVSCKIADICVQGFL